MYALHWLGRDHGCLAWIRGGACSWILLFHWTKGIHGWTTNSLNINRSCSLLIDSGWVFLYLFFFLIVVIKLCKLGFRWNSKNREKMAVLAQDEREQNAKFSFEGSLVQVIKWTGFYGKCSLMEKEDYNFSEKQLDTTETDFLTAMKYASIKRHVSSFKWR